MNFVYLKSYIRKFCCRLEKKVKKKKLREELKEASMNFFKDLINLEENAQLNLIFI